MSPTGYSRTDWTKEKRSPGDPGYVWKGLFAGPRNDMVGLFNFFSRIRQVLDAERGQVPGEGSLVEVAFEDPRARVAYRVDTVFTDRDPTAIQRDKFVLWGEAEEFTEGNYSLEEAPQFVEVGYASDEWVVLENEELDERKGTTTY